MAAPRHDGYFRAPMSSSRSRKARFPLTLRMQAASLLFAWFASLLLPAFHFDVEAASDEGHAHGAAGEQLCSGIFEPLGPDTSLTAACRDDGGCQIPWHHHHPTSHHDASQCPVCSSLLERISETPIFFDAAPTQVAFAARLAVRLPPVAERFVIALARGPPSSPSRFQSEGTLGT
jgi:hypothetical protein